MTFDGIVKRTADREAKGLVPVYAHATRPAGRAKVGRKPLPLAPCVHEGGVLERCGRCDDGSRDVRECDLYGRCTWAVVSAKVRACATCLEYQPADPA